MRNTGLPQTTRQPSATAEVAPRPAGRTQTAQPRQPEAPDTAQPDRTTAEFHRLIHRDVIPARAKGIALAVDAPEAPGGTQPALLLRAALASELGFPVVELGRLDLLKLRGFFTELYEGDQHLLGTAASISGAPFTLVGKLNMSFNRRSTLDLDLMTCELHLSCRVADKAGRTIFGDSVSALGPGYTESAALRTATAEIAKKLAPQLARNLQW